MKPPVCKSCHRPLRDPVSLARRYGPDCWAAEHPESAPRRRKAAAVTSARVKPGVIPGQEELFETLEGSDA